MFLGVSREQIAIVEDVAAGINITRKNLLATTMRKEPNLVKQDLKART
jgi:hypothetical protein